MSCSGVPGVKISATPRFLSAVMSSSGMMPPPKTTMSVAFRALQLLDHRGEQRHVRARVERQPDDLGVLLQRGVDHHLRRLAQPGVDDLVAGVAQRPRDDLDAAVVAVQADLGHHDPDRAAPRSGIRRPPASV